MRDNVRNILDRLHPRHISGVLEVFLKDESIGGKLILVAALLSLAIVNSPLRDEFSAFWHLPFSIGLDGWMLELDLRHLLNEGLMAFFFLVVGLEIKRELIKGELRDMKTAILPIGAAVGGMIIPAILYVVFNNQPQAIQGWGIPIATDIAFAVAVLSLLGSRVPLALKIFLLTLAIADDIGAIFVIALFYADIINYWFLAASFLLLFGLIVFRKHLTYRISVMVAAGAILWLTTHLSGIHASIVGAAIGLLAPVATSSARPGIAERAEKFFLPITTFVILPIFAFANAGFIISGEAFSSNQSVLLGIFLGLVLGKTLGITLASWLLVRLDIAKLPIGVTWRHIVGVGFIAGIGFTVSIFITELAFADNESLVNTAKIAIFLASATSAMLGYIILRAIKTKQP